VLVYAYCVGERSSRRIKRRLCKDVAFRVVAANQCPDHATLARFRRRHQEAIAGVFSQVLGLCVTEGLVQWGVVAINGRKPRRTAPSDSNSTATHGEPPLTGDPASLERIMRLIAPQAILASLRIASVMRRASSSTPRITPDLRFESHGNPMK